MCQGEGVTEDEGDEVCKGLWTTRRETREEDTRLWGGETGTVDAAIGGSGEAQDQQG